jgi:hypothetical protein
MARSKKKAKRVAEPVAMPAGYGERVIRVTRAGKVRKNFWLDPTALKHAKKYLGAATEREAVEMALDLVGFRSELSAGAKALRGMSVSRLD